MLADQLAKAQRLLQRFDEKATGVKAEWKAHHEARVAALTRKFKTAEAEVQKAEAARDKAASPNDILGEGQQQQHQRLANDVVMDGTGAPALAAAAGGGAPRAPEQPEVLLDFLPPPKLTPPSDPASLERLQKAKATTQLWQIQARDWAITAEALGLSLEEIAQLVGEANWTRTPALSTKADLPRPFVGVIGVALTELEISAAAIAARRSAAQEALKAQSLQMQHAGDQPAAKQPKLDDGATGQQ